MASGYLKKAFDPVLLRRIALETYLVMQQVEAEVVIARGLSGIVVATAMGTLFNAPFAIVRKPDESTHSTNGSLEVHTDRVGSYSERIYDDYIIVDDLISTGATMKAIAAAAKSSSTIDGRCVGIALYGNQYSGTSSKGTWEINGKQVRIFNVGNVEDV